MTSNKRSLRAVVASLMVSIMLLFSPGHVSADEQGTMGVIEEFTVTNVVEYEHLSDQEKKEYMFYMGFPLLLMLLITVSLGVAMAIYGKQVFVAHMVFAGLSVCLAIAHAVAGIVWFYPF